MFGFIRFKKQTREIRISRSGSTVVFVIAPGWRTSVFQQKKKRQLLEFLPFSGLGTWPLSPTALRTRAHGVIKAPCKLSGHNSDDVPQWLSALTACWNHRGGHEKAPCPLPPPFRPKASR